MLIALLTDFGLQDSYVGVMKGVMLRHAPNAQLVDLSHGIEAQNVRQGALTLMGAYRYFPKGTVFLVVVDPGVGTTRRPIAVQAGDYTFVAPDNGILSYTLAQLPNVTAVEITTDEIAGVSNTFHGRDVFAPVAAKLAAGAPLSSVGEPLTKLFSLPSPQLIFDERKIIGEIVHIDRFGNLITSIGHLRWINPERLMLHPAFGDHNENAIPIEAERATITLHDHTVIGIRQTYGEAERGGLLALVGSNAYLEIGVNQGNAAVRLDAAIGDRVELTLGGYDATVRD